MSEELTYREYLEKHGTLTYSNTGDSMLPLLRPGKDLFTVTKKGKERGKVGDVVLFYRLPDSYVLHRIIKVRPTDYVLMGDNCILKETGVTDEDILGVMTEYTKNGKTHSVEEPGYRLYSFLRVHTVPLRVFFKRVRILLKIMWKRSVGR